MTNQQALALLQDFEGVLDKQIYPEQVREGFDALPEREYSVIVTAHNWRRFRKAMELLEATTTA